MSLGRTQDLESENLACEQIVPFDHISMFVAVFRTMKSPWNIVPVSKGVESLTNQMNFELSHVTN